MTKHLGVVGAGAMGATLAQLAAFSRIEVALYDVNGTVLRQALERIKTELKRQVGNGELKQDDTTEAFGRIHPRTRLSDLNHCEIIIEAAIEDLRIKKDLFRHLEADTRSNTILASSTSTLSITSIASATRYPERVVGMHFPACAANRELVEVVKGQRTSEETVRLTAEFTQQLRKTPLVVCDSPGFLIDRLSQAYYGEAMRLLAENVADLEEIDRIVKVQGGFPMGPFEQMDAVGLDVLLATGQSLYDQYFGETRFRPLPLQKRMVDSGKLGRKSGEGFYTYSSGKS